jgi:carbamoyltransferase
LEEEKIRIMIILGINKTTHNGSVALLKDGELLFHLEGERLSNIKHDKFQFQALSKIKDYVDHVDHIVLSGFSPTLVYDKYIHNDAYTAMVLGLGKSFTQNNITVHDLWDKHHEMHAATAFYNSGFTDALCIVKDGAGSEYCFNNENYSSDIVGKEASTAFVGSYPNNFTMIDKMVTVPVPSKFSPCGIGPGVYATNTVSEAHAFEITAFNLGFDYLDAGKVMGLSAYGKPNKKFPPIYKNGLINDDIFAIENGEYVFKINLEDNFQEKADFAYALQTQIQEKVADYILFMLKQTGQKNLCLSGGFFLNCVSNYNLLKQLPNDVNIYIEPVSSDAGNAIGAALYIHHALSNNTEPKKRNDIYYGPKYKYDNNLLNNHSIIKNVSPADVAQLIADKNIVAIYQGGSESGPRALGNRSILYDPRDKDGKDHVNSVKKREWFRPFAGTVMIEHAKEWFDLRHLNESKFMMFAVDVLKDKQELIPAITHVDGTCRVQTLEKNDNINYYELIYEFRKITGVPILFNTSFNLAGNTIVETLDDALWTLYNSNIDYLYLPELKVVVRK